MTVETIHMLVEDNSTHKEAIDQMIKDHPEFNSPKIIKNLVDKGNRDKLKIDKGVSLVAICHSNKMMGSNMATYSDGQHTVVCGSNLFTLYRTAK